MEKRETHKLTYTITLTKYSDNSVNLTRTNNGFNILELLGVLELAQREIKEQIEGKIKPDTIKREVITHESKTLLPAIEDINFKTLRLNKKLTLRDVEEITDISNSYLSQLENGKISTPSYKIIKLLYELYNN